MYFDSVFYLCCVSLVTRLYAATVPCTTPIIPMSVRQSTDILAWALIRVSNSRHHCILQYCIPPKAIQYLSSLALHRTLHQFSYPRFKYLLDHDTFFVKERAVLRGALHAVLGEE